MRSGALIQKCYSLRHETNSLHCLPAGSTNHLYYMLTFSVSTVYRYRIEIEILTSKHHYRSDQHLDVVIDR